ncbi:MAG TPA: Sec-independent protein translocase protein TatB [Xanthobacteraceae bacterium]|jgi:sec-independent protein translocase protein TatB|nr:Sec-independent protein translocase protein TatB [Xanthobacteraceae bacterium]
MFDIGWSELLLIGVVALIAIGPKELPGALRAVGQWTGKIRRMASEFQDQFREAMREAEMADIKKDIDEAASKIHSDLDPFEFKDATSWKPAEPAAAPAADAPAAPPADAVAEPAQAATTTTQAATTTEPTPTNGEAKAVTPPADGGRAA